MKSIRKIDLKVEPSQKVSMPFNSDILKLDYVNKTPCLWILADETFSRSIERSFVMAEKEATQRMNSTTYIGTFTIKPEPSTDKVVAIHPKVLHLFEDT